MNCAIYARVSDVGQQDNTSLERQIAAGRAYAHGQGWTVITEARETFSGGAEMALGRPEFWRLLGLGEQRHIERIVVDVPDRLGRGEAIRKCQTLAEMSTCPVVYVNDPYALGDEPAAGEWPPENVMSRCETAPERESAYRDPQCARTGAFYTSEGGIFSTF